MKKRNIHWLTYLEQDWRAADLHGRHSTSSLKRTSTQTVFLPNRNVDHALQHPKPKACRHHIGVGGVDIVVVTCPRCCELCWCCWSRGLHTVCRNDTYIGIYIWRCRCVSKKRAADTWIESLFCRSNQCGGWCRQVAGNWRHTCRVIWHVMSPTLPTLPLTPDTKTNIKSSYCPVDFMRKCTTNDSATTKLLGQFWRCSVVYQQGQVILGWLAMIINPRPPEATVVDEFITWWPGVPQEATQIRSIIIIDFVSAVFWSCYRETAVTEARKVQ